MSEQGKWTKGPWHVEDSMVFAENTLRVADCYCADQEQTEDEIEANAARIVQCVNSHDTLVEALKGAQEELRLIRMKDTNVVYNPALKAQISLALAQAERP
jgi:phosphoribosylamine-glycine ligase